MPKQVAGKASSAVKKTATSARAAVRKTAVKKAAVKKATVKKAAKKKTAAAPKKRVGDVLGVSSTTVPKAKNPPKSAGRKRKPQPMAKRAMGPALLKPSRARH